MSKQNPYEEFMEGRPAETILAGTPEALRGMLAEIGEAEVSTRPAPGKWSPAEIVCHLADCEMVFGFRLRQTLAEDQPTVQPFNQDKWADQYSGIPADRALETFAALRQWNLSLIRAALPGAAARVMVHPQRGAVSFQSFVDFMAGHDLNHLRQMRLIAGPAQETTPPVSSL